MQPSPPCPLWSPSRRRWLGAAGAAWLLSACGGGGGGDGGGGNLEPIATSLDTLTPENQAATFRHIDRLYATRRFARGSTVRALPAHPVSLDGLRFAAAAGSTSIDEHMARHRSSGLLVLKDGRIALERYAMGNTASSLWTSFSVAKSLTSTLIGLALQDGRIGSLDDAVDAFVPALRGSAYEGCSIRSLLRMTSGVAWNEDYTSASSDIARLRAVFTSGQPGAMLELMRTRPRAAPVGSVWNYSTGETYVLGAVLAAATGGTLADALSRGIWGPAGMEADGYWLLDAPGGLEMGGSNFSATLRDHGRLGLFVLEGGTAGSPLPAGWSALAGRPDNAVTGYGQLLPGGGYPLGYGYQWWSFPSGGTFAPHAGAFVAQGIFGQFLYVNPAQRVVAVVWSAWPDVWTNTGEFDTYALLGAAVTALAS